MREPRFRERPVVMESFELRQVDGMQAYLGSLRVVGGETVLDPGSGRAPIPLGEVPDELAGGSEGLVWVAGSWGGGVFLVVSFGMLAVISRAWLISRRRVIFPLA